MENLKRYAPQLGNGINYMGMGEVKEGAWVKFSDIKELLAAAHNRTICKRPLNVDIICKLRVMGWAKNSFTFESDEGDGYDIIPGYMDGEGPTLKPHHYEEWAEQLSYAVQWCNEKARMKAAESAGTDTQQC
jgi:hypothetical protein